MQWGFPSSAFIPEPSEPSGIRPEGQEDAPEPLGWSRAGNGSLILALAQGTNGGKNPFAAGSEAVGAGLEAEQEQLLLPSFSIPARKGLEISRSESQ